MFLQGLNALQASGRQEAIVKRKYFSLLVTFILILFVAPNLSANSTEKEVQARKAEQAGKLQEALADYVSLLRSVTAGSATDRRLREKIIKLVKRIQPPPAIPEGAIRHIGRGQAVSEIAEGLEDYIRAIAEFEKAVRLAPWLADGYYNLGMVQEKVGRFSDAVHSFKLYLLVAPSATNVREVRTKMYGLEYKMERQRAALKARDEEEEKRAQISRIKKSLSGGNWCLKEMYDQYSSECYQRPTSSGGDISDMSWVRLLASGDRITIRLQWDNGGRALFDGKIKGLRLVGTQEIACCPRDYIAEFPFTGRISSDGKTITIRPNRTSLFGKNKKYEIKEYVFIRAE